MLNKALMYLLVWLFASQSLAADYGTGKNVKTEALTIYAVNIPGYHQLDNNGIYDALIMEAAAGLAAPIDLQVRPPKRTFKAFEDCSNCCLTPASDNPQFVVFPNVVVSKPMQVAKLIAFTKRGASPIRSVDELSGLTVSRRHGITYSKNLQREDINFVFASDIKGSIRMLEKGRTDAFVAFTPDVYRAFEELGVEAFPHDVDRPIAIHSDSLICKDEIGRNFVKVFDRYLETQKAKNNER